MKKSTTRVTMVIIMLVLAVVGYYAFLSNREKETRAEGYTSAVQTALSRNLNNDYPPTPKEVLKYYNELMRCFYNEQCTDQEIDALGMKARELYDEELLAVNEVGSYLINLRNDIQDFQKASRRITNISLAGSTSVKYATIDGNDFATIQCTYTVNEGGVSKGASEIYLLRKDENHQWKIYGWEAAPSGNGN
ncbi:MAG: hypothetical protein J1E64_07975 [Acetatifactor sp.]|nr:hypothetical protein [Acetatifactor sp.]